MTLRDQLHNSATHKPGFDPACPACVRDTDIWHTIESSRMGADDWVRHGADTYDSQASGEREVSRLRAEWAYKTSGDRFEFRLVRITQTETVVF